MKLKKLLALLLCLTFAAAVLTGCGGDQETYEEDNSIYDTGDLSTELDMMVFSDGVLKAAFVGDTCYIDMFEDEDTMEAVDQGVYTWDGTYGTIDGEYDFMSFTIEDDILVLELSDGGIYTMPAVDDISFEEGDESSVSLIENTSWWLEDLEYTFLPDGVLQAYNSTIDQAAEGSYTWDPHTMGGTVTIGDEYQDFLYQDGQVVIIDGLGDEYPLNPMGEGGLNDDGMGAPGFGGRIFYYEDLKLSFAEDGRMTLMIAGDADFMSGNYKWDPHTEYGMVTLEDGTMFKFTWDGEDMFIYDAEDTEYWMDEEPDPEYFDE